jgi:L-rhamnose mutarotase
LPEFVGLRTRLKPGLEKAYQAAHVTVRPQVLDAQGRLTRWLIFGDGLDLFDGIEHADHDRAVAELAKLRVNQRRRRRWRSTRGSPTSPAATPPTACG